MESTYSMVSKIGTMEVTTERLIVNNKTIYNTAEDFFEKTGPREKWHSSRFEELLIFCGTKLSTRDTSSLIDLISGRNDVIIPTTVRNHLERHGTEIAAKLSEMVNEALSPDDIKEALERDLPYDLFNEPRFTMDPTLVSAAADNLGVTMYNQDDYENPDLSANISIDDICVKAQKPMRPMLDGKEKKKRVDNTVAHIENIEGKYVFNGDGIAAVVRQVIGFMAFNQFLLKGPLVFFCDGARTIHDEIKEQFKFTKYKIILDYYHLSKKVKEFFSMAFNGKEISKKMHNEIMKLLWVGDVKAALAFMEHVDKSKVKDQNRLTQLADYLKRVRDCIPNYALRKELGLRNGSGVVEKVNDLLVAKRQKHNGMSWSKPGSVGLASVTCAKENGALGDWTQKRVIPFRPVPALDLAA